MKLLRRVFFFFLSLFTGPFLIPYVWISKKQRDRIPKESRLKLALMHAGFLISWGVLVFSILRFSDLV